MQTDKATLTFAGEALYTRGIRALQAVCSEVIIAGMRNDLDIDKIHSYADTYPDSALGGLHNAICHTGNEWVCVLPCDLPFPSANLLRQLIKRRNGYDAVIPRTPRGPEPLIGCYNKRVLPVIERQLEANNLRLTSLLNLLHVCYLDPQDLPTGWRRAIHNLNTPQDLESLNASPPVLTFVAHSGTGKTTLLVKVIAELTSRGWTIGALKHDAHRFNIDRPGKDSWRMTQAGATITAISSDEQTAVIQRHMLPPTLEQILAPFRQQVDLVLTEGYKQSELPKIEVHRQESGQQLICRGERHDPTLLAVASDVEFTLDVPVFMLDDPISLSDFIEETFLS